MKSFPTALLLSLVCLSCGGENTDKTVLSAEQAPQINEQTDDIDSSTQDDELPALSDQPALVVYALPDSTAFKGDLLTIALHVENLAQGPATYGFGNTPTNIQ